MTPPSVPTYYEGLRSSHPSLQTDPQSLPRPVEVPRGDRRSGRVLLPRSHRRTFRPETPDPTRPTPLTTTRVTRTTLGVQVLSPRTESRSLRQRGPRGRGVPGTRTRVTPRVPEEDQRLDWKGVRRVFKTPHSPVRVYGISLEFSVSMGEPIESSQVLRD